MIQRRARCIFQLRADNDFFVHDKIAFETGGVLSGAGANATIDVTSDIAHEADPSCWVHTGRMCLSSLKA